MSLKKMPDLNHFKLRKNVYKGQAIIGENTGNDKWPVNAKVWKEPHENSWRWSYKSGTLLTPKHGVAYEPQEQSGEGFATAVLAHEDLKENMRKNFA